MSEPGPGPLFQISMSRPPISRRNDPALAEALTEERRLADRAVSSVLVGLLERTIVCPPAAGGALLVYIPTSVLTGDTDSPDETLPEAWKGLLQGAGLTTFQFGYHVVGAFSEDLAQWRLLNHGYHLMYGVTKCWPFILRACR